MRALLGHWVEAIVMLLVATACGLFVYWFVTPTPCHKWADGAFRSIPNGLNATERFEYRKALYDRCRAERAGEAPQPEAP